MNIIRKILKTIGRDITNLTKSKLPLKFRLIYPLSKYIALIRNFTLKKKYITYFNQKFFYDNWTIPISLQSYPYEISCKILKNVNTEINNILDIGANIGQFSVTFKNILPNTRIFCFEPNSKIFNLLKKNTSAYQNIQIFNLGVGTNQKQTLYFDNLKSATGSIYKETFNHNPSESLEITTTNNLSEVTKENHFDLMKIDVEGYEFEVIKNLKDISTKYLYIEISGARKKNYNHSELLNTIESKLGTFNIVYINEFEKNQNNFEALLKF